jgi:hypothetical protein
LVLFLDFTSFGKSTKSRLSKKPKPRKNKIKNKK